MKTLESERLIIRDWLEDDASDLYSICLDTELQRCGVSSYSNIDEASKTIHLWKELNDMRAIVCKENNQLIGLIGLGDMNRYNQYKELEFAISINYRNKGYATEALNALLGVAFGELDILVVAAWVRSFNTNSVRVLTKCGFTHEGTLRRHARDRGDTLCFSILKEEWEETRTKLA